MVFPLSVPLTACLAGAFAGAFLCAAPARGADKIPALKASGISADNKRVSVMRKLSQLDPSQFDIVRRSRSGVTLGFPETRSRQARRNGFRRCATITYRVRVTPLQGTALDYVRRTMPTATEEGFAARAGVPSPDPFGAASAAARAWRLSSTLIDNGLLAQDGVSARVLPNGKALEVLTVKLRVRRPINGCADGSRISSDVDPLSPLYV